MSSWTDKKAVETTLKIRDDFQIREFIETGTYKGTNVRLYADKFEQLKSCDIEGAYLEEAMDKLKHHTNVTIYGRSSPIFLKDFIKRYRKEGRSDIVFIYLDAHFYRPNAPADERFVVLNELKALKGFTNCVIAIHDFDNKSLGHITYDGIKLDLDLIRKDLMKVNPNFKLYTNTLLDCDIVSAEEIKAGKIKGLIWDAEMESTMKFVWSNDVKKYRGILYATPRELNLDNYDLVRHGS